MTRRPQHTWPARGLADAQDEHGLRSSNLAVVLRVLGHRHRLRQRDRWTHEQLRAYQARALQQLRTHAHAHSPFYGRFHAGRTDRPLQELPVLTKAMVMEHFNQLVTDPAVRLAEVEAHLAARDGNQRYRGAGVDATSRLHSLSGGAEGVGDRPTAARSGAPLPCNSALTDSYQVAFLKLPMLVELEESLFAVGKSRRKKCCDAVDVQHLAGETDLTGTPAVSGV